MGLLHVRLLGTFGLDLDGQDITGLESTRAQELFAYLLLNRDRQLVRETIAGTLWGDGSGERARKCLRQALWQLQAALAHWEEGHLHLRATPTYLCLRSGATLSIDAANLEQAFAGSQGIPGHELDLTHLAALRNAIVEYSGDLLAGWYYDWCVYERERFRDIYLAILDKLVVASGARGDFENAVECGTRILLIDRARERTHRQLMKIYVRAGDRTGALRQYDRCVSALRDELGVAPTVSTTALYDQIRQDTIGDVSSELDHLEMVGDSLSRLQNLRQALRDLQRQMIQDIRAAESAHSRPGASV